MRSIYLEDIDDTILVKDDLGECDCQYGLPDHLSVPACVIYTPEERAAANPEWSYDFMMDVCLGCGGIVGIWG